MVERSLHMPEFILIDNFFFFLLKWFPEYWKEFQAMYWYEMYLSDCHVSVFLFKKIFLKFHLKKNIEHCQHQMSCNKLQQLSFQEKKRKKNSILWHEHKVCVFTPIWVVNRSVKYLYTRNGLNHWIEYWILNFIFFAFPLDMLSFSFLLLFQFLFFFLFLIFARECIYFGLWQKINKNFFYDP